MANLNVAFIHPTDGRRMDVEVDSEMTSKEAIDELITSNFIVAKEEGYGLSIKGGDDIPENRTFADAGVKDGTVLRVSPHTDAG